MKLRTEKILQTLLFSEQYITVEDLSSEHKVGVRTIQNDISEINKLLKQKALPLIQSIRKKGLFLELSSAEIDLVCKLLKENKNKYELYYNKDIRIFHLILELTLGASFYVYEKEEEFGISKSALDSDMRDLRKLLAAYNIELKSDLNEGLMLNGSERKIRTMIFDQIFEHLKITDLFDQTNYILSQYQVFFNFIPIDFIYKLNNLYSIFYESKNYLYRDELLIILSIWILRNNKLASHDNFTNNFDSQDSESFIKKVISEFKLNPNKYEIVYINLVMSALSYDIDLPPADWMQLQIFTVNLINTLQSKLGIYYHENSEELFRKLFEHNIRLYARIKKNLQLFNPLTDDIKDDYGEIFQIVKNYFISELGLNIRKIKDDEIAFIVIHFLAAQSRVEQNQKRAFKAVVFCNYGLATGAFLSEKLQQHFPIEVVATLNTDEIYLLDKLEYDVIFSTRKMDIKQDSYLVINPIMDEKSIRSINKFLNKHKKTIVFQNKEEPSNMMLTEIINLIEDNYGSVNLEIIGEIVSVFKKNNINVDIEVIQPMIKDVLTKDNIKLNLNVNNWKEAIEKSAQPLIENNTIEDRYVKAMIAAVKEHGPYIVLGDGLALAHARPEDGVNAMGLSVATLNPPIDFGESGEHYVDIVFCLAAVDSYSHLNIIKSLVNLLNEEETLFELKQTKNIEEFTNILFKK